MRTRLMRTVAEKYEGAGDRGSNWPRGSMGARQQIRPLDRTMPRSGLGAGFMPSRSRRRSAACADAFFARNIRADSLGHPAAAGFAEEIPPRPDALLGEGQPPPGRAPGGYAQHGDATWDEVRRMYPSFEAASITEARPVEFLARHDPLGTAPEMLQQTLRNRREVRVRAAEQNLRRDRLGDLHQAAGLAEYDVQHGAHIGLLEFVLRHQGIGQRCLPERQNQPDLSDPHDRQLKAFAILIAPLRGGGGGCFALPPQVPIQLALPHKQLEVRHALVPLALKIGQRQADAAVGAQ